MSDIRTKILLGTTISAVSMMLVMAIGISTEQNNANAGTALGLMGHFEIMVENPDGTVSYAQGDNFVTGAAKNQIGNAAFEGAALPGTFTCTRLGTGTPVITADGVNAPLTVTGTVCDSDNTNNCADAGATDPATQAQNCTVTTVHTIDGTTDCPTSCTVTEVELGFDAAPGASGTLDNIFAYTALTGGGVVANNGATFTTTYVVANGGTVSGT